MASITITVPDAVVADVLDAFAAKFGRPDQIQNPDWEDDGSQTDPDAQGDPRFIANPETKAAFAKRMIAKQIKKIYLERKEDEENATKAANMATHAQTVAGIE